MANRESLERVSSEVVGTTTALLNVISVPQPNDEGFHSPASPYDGPLVVDAVLNSDVCLTLMFLPTRLSSNLGTDCCEHFALSIETEYRFRPCT